MKGKYRWIFVILAAAVLLAVLLGWGKIASERPRQSEQSPNLSPSSSFAPRPTPSQFPTPNPDATGRVEVDLQHIAPGTPAPE